MSQRERIENWLEERGERGVHSFELYQEKMPRGAAVIDVLRKDGLDIESRPERFQGDAKGVRYILRGKSASVEREPGSLFAQPVGKGASPYEYDLI